MGYAIIPDEGRTMRRLIRRAAIGLAALSAPLALAVMAAPAGAVLNHNAVQTVGNGAAGYSVTNSIKFRNAGEQIVTAPAALNIGHISGFTNTGGLGTQLCDPNSGFGGQIGEVSNGTDFAVEYAVGTLTGAAVDNCVGNPLLPTANHIHPTTLDHVKVGDSVDVFIRFKNIKVNVTTCHRVRHHAVCVTHKAWRGRMKFQAQDETSGFEVFASRWIHTRANWNLTEAGFGVQQETSGLSADTPLTCPNGTPAGVALAAFPPGCPGWNGHAPYDQVVGPHGTGAHTLLACFASFVNGVGLALPPISGPPIMAYRINEVATTGNGLNANTALVAPNSSLLTSPATQSVCPLPDAPVSFGPHQVTFADYVGNVTH